MPAELYTQISSFEPLLPSFQRDKLAALTCQIFLEAGRLGALLPSPLVKMRVANLVREMNSYYSNLIEGHKTSPQDIEKALKADFSTQPLKRSNQHLARAHIEAETAMIDRLNAEPELNIHAPEFICWLHQEFYQRLPEDLHVGEKMDGSKYQISIGTLRDYEVTVSSHQPPRSDSVPEFMRRFDTFYNSHGILETNQLLALAAAHHRLAWIHPFGDGNGRVARLHTHAWLHHCKVGALGLWTISRGLARQCQEYYSHLSAADSVRHNDYDGRGNLSDRALSDFCMFFLTCILDQISFMSSMLDLQNLARRIEAHLHVAYPDWSTLHREQMGRLLKAALIEGSIERGSVADIIGRQTTTASKLIHLALETGLLDSTNRTKGPLSLVFDSKVLTSYFPQLYQDLPISTR